MTNYLLMFDNQKIILYANKKKHPYLGWLYDAPN